MHLYPLALDIAVANRPCACWPITAQDAFTITVIEMPTVRMSREEQTLNGSCNATGGNESQHRFVAKLMCGVPGERGRKQTIVEGRAMGSELRALNVLVAMLDAALVEKWAAEWEELDDGVFEAAVSEEVQRLVR